MCNDTGTQGAITIFSLSIYFSVRFSEAMLCIHGCVHSANNFLCSMMKLQDNFLIHWGESRCLVCSAHLVFIYIYLQQLCTKENDLLSLRNGQLWDKIYCVTIMHTAQVYVTSRLTQVLLLWNYMYVYT